MVFFLILVCEFRDRHRLPPACALQTDCAALPVVVDVGFARDFVPALSILCSGLGGNYKSVTDTFVISVAS